jgi:serine/threonine protein phosphatase PrpC
LAISLSYITPSSRCHYGGISPSVSLTAQVGSARVFLPTGVSVMCTRSIGDRDTKLGNHGAITALPDISNVEVPLADGGRIVLASDGLWDVFSSNKTVEKLKSQSACCPLMVAAGAGAGTSRAEVLSKRSQGSSERG